MTSQDIKDLIDYVMKNNSWKEVAKIFNTTGETIRQVLKRNNIERYNLCGRKKVKVE